MDKKKRPGRNISEEAVRTRCNELGLIYVSKYVKNSKTHVNYLCPKHRDKGEISSAWTRLRTAKHGCPYCSGKYKTTYDFILEVSAILPNVQVTGEYKTARSKIESRCLICGHEWTPEARSLLYGEGCPICAKRKKAESRRKTHQEFERDLFAVAPNINVISEYIGSHKKIRCRCTKHNNEWESYPANLLNKSAGCPMCATERFNNSPSLGELRIRNWLDCNGFRYEAECSLDGCTYKKPLRFDFYLPDQRIAIEYDGEQHFHPVWWYANDAKAFNDVQVRDLVKNDYCKQNGIYLLRIPYNDYDKIHDILNSAIKEELRPH